MKQSTRDQIAMLRTVPITCGTRCAWKTRECSIENDVNFHQYYMDYWAMPGWPISSAPPWIYLHRFRYITSSSMKMNHVFVEEHLLIMKAIEDND